MNREVAKTAKGEGLCPTERVLSLDAASQVCGYAVGTGPGAAGLIEAGVLKPRPQSGAVLVRAASLAGDVVQLIDEHQVAVVVAETPGLRAPAWLRKKRGRDGRKIQPRAQANYGLGVGAILGRVAQARPAVRLEAVPADQWTRGQAKWLRAELLRMVLPEVDFRADKGHDCADAIELLWWWFAQRELAESRR